MGTVRYTVIDGEILSENRDGVKRDYVPDPQGNVIALLDNTQTKTDTFDYFPYGEVANRTGTTQTPFQYLGAHGYYKDNSGRTYVRHRFLDTAHVRWMTQDPIGFGSGDWNLYRYVENNPVLYADPSGEQKKLQIPSELKKCLNSKAQAILLKMINDSSCADAIKRSCKMDALKALNSKSYVPKWTFPNDCGKDDKGNPLLGNCTFTFPGHKRHKKGDAYMPYIPCKPTGICIIQKVCHGDPRLAASTALWELGNACSCKNEGFDPTEDGAMSIAHACGFDDIAGPGGIQRK